MKVLVIGASRGIGWEWVSQALAAGAQVSATARDEDALARLKTLGADPIALDVSRAESCSRLAWQIDGAGFDEVVFCAGVYGVRTQGLQPPTQTDFDAVMHTNVLGPMRVLPQLAEALGDRARVAIVSSRMGSIGERTDSAGWLYRASKAAANSVLKDCSLAFAGKAICVSLHPGWVRTDMGGPNAQLDVVESVRGMRQVLAGLSTADNGAFFNHDGSRIAW